MKQASMSLKGAATMSRLEILSIVCACIGLLITAPAGAVVVMQESFDYGVGELDGQSGGTGFGANAWGAVTAYSEVIDTGTDPDLGAPLSSGDVNGGDRAVRIDGNPNQNNMISRQLASPATGNDYYFSFLLRWANGLDSNDFILVWLDDQTADWHRTGAGHKGAANQFFIRLSGGDAFDGSMGQDTTYHVVARFFKQAPSQPDLISRAEVYVNPAYEDYGNGSYDAVVAVGVTHRLTSFDRVGLYTGGGIESTDRIFIDELKIGTTWDDVVVPEPGTVGVLCVGGVLSFLRRRRR